MNLEVTHSPSPREVMYLTSFYRMRQDDPGMKATPGAGLEGVAVDPNQYYGNRESPAYDPAVQRATQWVSATEAKTNMNPYQNFDWVKTLGLKPDQYRTDKFGNVSYNMMDLTPEQKQKYSWEWNRRRAESNATHQRRVTQGLTKVAALAALGWAGGAIAGAGGGSAGGTAAATSAAPAATGTTLASTGGTMYAVTGAPTAMGAATTTGAGLGAAGGGMTLSQGIGAGLGAASSYMSAKEQQKLAKEAAKSRPSESYRTPYGNEFIAKLIPYILSSANQVFQNRMSGYGLQPMSYQSYSDALAGVSKDYSGVGKP